MTVTRPPEVQRIPTKNAQLGGGLTIRRALPSRQRRLIGAWCFLDHAGPTDLGATGMRVGPHPHTGLQTFTWMIEGAVLHRDSLGYEQLIRPGQVNLMTAGQGISHAELSPEPRPPRLHLAQLWIALPATLRQMPPAFTHYPVLPQLQQEGFTATVLVGELLGRVSPVAVHSPLAGFDLTATAAATTQWPLRPDFEYGVLVLEGEAEVAGQHLPPGELLYLGLGHQELRVRCGHGGVRLLLIGGEPYTDEVLLWWNFVDGSSAAIAESIAEWNAGAERFGQLPGLETERLSAPLLPGPLKVGE